MHPNPIAKARFENQKAMYEEEDKKLKERWEKERAAEESAARGKGSGDNENVFEEIGRDYAENAQAEQKIEDKRWEGFGDFFAKEGGTAGQRQAPGFNYGGRESEHSGRSRSDNMALAMGVEEELLDKIAAEAKEKKGKDIFTEGIESSVWSTSAGITGLADMFIGKPLQSLGWEDNFISEWNKYYQDKAEEKHQDVMDAAARTGKGKTAETAAILVEMLGEAGIDALLGMVTGGISLAGKGGKVLKYADDVGDLAKLDLDDTKRGIDYFNNIKYNELKEYLNYKKNHPKTTYLNYKKVKALDEIGIEGVKSVPPKTIDVSSLRFKDNHAMRHGCLENDAKNFVKNAKCSITRKRWDGFSENYYSDEGAAYIDIETGYIKTAFFKEDFDPKTQEMMEVLK